MADLGWIEIPGWDRFQHADVTRGETVPPWIKTYTRLMHDEDYLRLPVGTALVLHRLWLEYASTRCRLRADTRSLSARLRVRVTSTQLRELVDAGFLTLREGLNADLASNLQAGRKQDASTRDAREEGEGEKKDRSRNPTVDLATPRGNGDGDGSEITHKPLVEDADDWGLEPIAGTVEELRQRWGETA